MPQRVRTFIAAETSSEVRACAADAIDQLSSAGVRVSWVRPENLHLTIKFLGDVDYTALSDVCRSLARAATENEPFELQCGGVGAFPRPERPRTIWLGVEDPDKRLAKLAKDVEDAMAELRFRRESRPFHGHLTLGRVRDGRQSAELAGLIQSESFATSGIMMIDELIVFSSELTPEGPIYTSIGRAELGGEG